MISMSLSTVRTRQIAARGIIKRIAVAARTCDCMSERAVLANPSILAATKLGTSLDNLGLSKELVHEICMAILNAPIAGSRRQRAL